jgi:hypothetical protein
MSNTVKLTLAETAGFPQGSTLGGYLVALTGASTGALPTFLVPANQVSANTPTLAPDTWTGTVTNVQSDGATPVPGAPVVSIPAFVVSAPQPVTLNIATGAVLS